MARNARIAAVIACSPLWVQTAIAEAIPVELLHSDDRWQLLRDGEPYFIKGAGGSHSLEQLAAAGANSVRTWDADNIDALLDEAHTLNLSVAVGIWLGHERHGFDYSDDEQVAEQFARAERLVSRYKDHPAVLLWGVGNEMEGFAEGDNPDVWKAVEAIAAMIKAIDPHHPTMTVTSEVGGERIEAVHHGLPSIDIHGINSYGGAASLVQRLNAGGARKPFILTEFGPPGSWEAPTTAWGAPLELTSSQKASAYQHHYERAITQAPSQALGAYAFTWGSKMEATSSWFGMFLSDGARLSAVDAMSEIWSGRRSDNLAPSLQPLLVDGDTESFPGDEITVSYLANDPEEKLGTVRWALRAETNDYLTGGDFRPQLPDVDGVVLEQGEDHVRLRMPEEPGAYRLYLTVYDDAGSAATANVPLLVKGQVKTQMPVNVYHDGFEGMPWAPSGWMGNVEMLSLDGIDASNPHSGDAAIRARYEGPFGWVGVAWQHPANNWGEMDGGFDLSGASELEFWARGEYGGEIIGYGVGLLGDDVSFSDSAVVKIDGIALTSTWKRYSVPLGNENLSSIKTGFFVTLAGRATPVTVYLDRIRYVR